MAEVEKVKREGSTHAAFVSLKARITTALDRVESNGMDMQEWPSAYIVVESCGSMYDV
jgi:hypothetical protein